MLKKLFNCFLILCFFFVTVVPSQVFAGGLGLPEPGTMVGLSKSFEPAIIKGLVVHQDNPFLFNFIVDPGQDELSGDALKKEGERLIKYFLASLALPEKDVWVNLSPYEKDKTIGLDEPLKNALGDFIRDEKGRVEFFRIGGRAHKKIK